MGLNDAAWATLFDRHDILEKVDRVGFFEIDSDEIKTVREPRLMAKFDHRSNLPEIFRQNELSILPISRSRYVIGHFHTYQVVTYNAGLNAIPIHFPSDVASIEPTNLYSESAALHCAYVSGMIDHLFGEKFVPTISGRMSSKNFEFYIQTRAGSERKVEISNSQLEIDGGYESDTQLVLIEAKKETTEDFLIRQLYYPYRLWQDKINKKVSPVFFTHSNDIFSFFVYEFTDPTKYNSLKLLYQRDYIIAHEDISQADILQLTAETEIIPEPAIPFPQADNFVRIVDLLGLLMESDLNKDEITANYNFDSRRTNYYTSAGMYLGLVERYLNASQEVVFRLTARGRQIMVRPYKYKYLLLASCIAEHKVFQRALTEYQQEGQPPDRTRVVEIMKTCHLYGIGKDSTYFRRAQTVMKWVTWVVNLQKK